MVKGKNHAISILVAIILSIAAWTLLPALEPAARAVAAITTLVAILWFTEGLPLWVTALLVPVLLVVVAQISPTKAFAPFFDPVIVLLLGGFVLGRAVQKYGLDVKLVRAFIAITGNGAKSFLLGIVAAAAFLSFWISNTAAAALMMPVGLAAIAANKLEKGSNYAKATVLGIGYGATIGGIGTLIGTPPNLITVRGLAEAGVTIDFLGWAVRAVPLVFIMIPLAWLSLMLIFRPEVRSIRIPQVGKSGVNRMQKAVLAIFIITAALWLTEPLHRIHNSVVAMLPPIALFGSRMLGKEDIGMLGWDMLILIGGGLAMGSALVTTGLDRVMADSFVVFLSGYPTFLLFFLLSIFTIAFTAFVANTAAAAILIPVMIPLSHMLGISPLSMAMLIGLVVSFDFIVPVGTPPNAIAYGTGYISVKDMIKAGLLLSVIGALVVAAGALLWIK